jgi:DNA replication initiation complex subunit (GINS family)
MKNLFLVFTLFLIGCSFLAVSVISCNVEPDKNYVNTNVYALSSIEYIPDSLKSQYREWVKETVRAASQNMTGGDYERADKTIMQAEESGKRLFGEEILGLRVKYSEYIYKYVTPSEMTSEEKDIFNKLLNRIKNQ